ncbi:MAG TPA: hypothetical protein VFR11_22225 [Micromonosporaceae bacterium]|nr:hypothetical protein [Micromonosporaceae bacterium]
MIAPWQFSHDLVHLRDADFTRAARRASQLAEWRHGRGDRSLSMWRMLAAPISAIARRRAGRVAARPVRPTLAYPGRGHSSRARS